MKSGLEISAEMLELQELLDSDDVDFDNPQVQALICNWAQALDEERIVKADNICALIMEWLARSAFRKQEAERLQRRAVVDENNAKRLKSYLHFLLRTWGLRKIETPRYSVAIAANGGKQPLEIAPELLAAPEKLPEQYQLKRDEINRESIRATLEAGGEVLGCQLLERGESLRIR